MNSNIDNIFTVRRLGLLTLIFLSIIVSVLLTYLPYKFQIAMVAAIPAFIMALTVLANVYWGVFYYFLYEFLRPVDFIPALGPLKIVMFIEMLTLLSWLIYLARNHKNIDWDIFKSFYVGFIAVTGVTIITALNNRSAFNVTQNLLVNFLIFMIATDVVNSHKRLNNLIWLLLVIHLYHAYKGIYNYAVVGYVAGGERTSGLTGSGFIGDENDFAMALNVMIPFAYFYFMYARGVFKKYFSLILLIIFVIGVISSASRGGWVGLVIIIVYCIYRSKQKLLGFGIASVLAIAVVLFAPSEYWQRIQTIENVNEGTARSRINYWKASVRMFMHNPLVGIGAGNGPNRMPEFVTGFQDNATQWGRTFHGTLPQVLGELGGFGIGLYLTMLFYSLGLLSKIRKKAISDRDDANEVMSNAITGSIIGFIVTATFLSAAYYPQLWTLYAFTIILKYISEKSNHEPTGQGILIK